MGLSSQEFLFPFSHRDITKKTKAGYVYGMADASNPGIVKLGFSTDPLERLDQLNRQTASLGTLYLVFMFRCDSAREHEQSIFKALNPWRLKQPRARRSKEFFKFSPVAACVYLAEYFERDPDVLVQIYKNEFQQLKEERAKASLR